MWEIHLKIWWPAYLIINKFFSPPLVSKWNNGNIAKKVDRLREDDQEFGPAARWGWVTASAESRTLKIPLFDPREMRSKAYLANFEQTISTSGEASCQTITKGNCFSKLFPASRETPLAAKSWKELANRWSKHSGRWTTWAILTPSPSWGTSGWGRASWLLRLRTDIRLCSLRVLTQTTTIRCKTSSASFWSRCRRN